MIEPTVGRIMWYWPASGDTLFHNRIGSQPLAAIITGVISNTEVNLVVFNSDGVDVRNRVPILDGDYKWEYSFASWMPYQKGQAAKTEALQAQAAPEVPHWAKDHLAVLNAMPPGADMTLGSNSYHRPLPSVAWAPLTQGKEHAD